MHLTEDGPIIYLVLEIFYTLQMSEGMHILQPNVKDGYQWDVLFNNAHRNHDYMIYWFGIPRDQNPTGPVTLTVINRDGTSTSSGGVGFGSGQPYQHFGKLLVQLNQALLPISNTDLQAVILLRWRQ